MAMVARRGGRIEAHLHEPTCPLNPHPCAICVELYEAVHKRVINRSCQHIPSHDISLSYTYDAPADPHLAVLFCVVSVSLSLFHRVVWSSPIALPTTSSVKDA